MMDLDESPLLHEPDLMLAMLRVAAAKTGTLDDCIRYLRRLRDCAKVDEPIPEDDLRARLETVKAKLGQAGLLELPPANGFRITSRGRRALADHPDGIDDSVLLQFERFRAASGPGQSSPARGPTPPSRYESGYEAYGVGRTLADNPYPPDARAHLDWANGWSQARDDASQRSRRD